MVSIGGQTRPYIGDPIASNNVSGGYQTSNSGFSMNTFFWNGPDKSGVGTLLSSPSCRGFIPFQMSGLTCWLAYWISA